MGASANCGTSCTNLNKSEEQAAGHVLDSTIARWQWQYQMSDASRALMQAVKAGDTATAGRFLRGLAVPDCCDGDGTTPLHLACFSGQGYMVQLLLEHGACVDAPDSLKYSGPPCTLASQLGHAECLQQLLSSRANPNSKVEPQRHSCLHLAAAGGHLTCVRLLLSAHNPTAKVAARGSLSQTVLAPSDLLANTLDAGGRLPLHAAATSGHAACLAILISEGFCLLDVVDVEGDGAIHIAALHLHDEGVAAEMCRILAEAGATINLRSASGETALHLAAEHARGSVCSTLLRHAADANIADGMRHRRPLHLAACADSIEVCRQLLAARADPCVMDLDRCTAMMCASSDPCRGLLASATRKAEHHSYEVAGNVLVLDSGLSP